jgi:hypothetical protein
MRPFRLLSCLALAGAVGLSMSTAASDDQPPSEADAAKRWKEAAQLGPHHKELEYFLGTWDGVIEFVMPGMLTMPPEKRDKVVGTGAWAIEGRWLSFRIKGTMMGQPFEGFGLSGYDNVKKAHVSTFVSNIDTAMTTASGSVVDPNGKIVSMYGTIDEYLTGEHDKPVRITRKIVSPDQFVHEIWDLGIGELGQVVLRETFTRRK